MAHSPADLSSRLDPSALSPEDLLSEKAVTALMRNDPDAASAWMAELPEKASRYLNRWGLSPLHKLAGGVRSAVLLCDDDPSRDTFSFSHRLLVLKLHFLPSTGLREAAALSAWAPTGAAVPLLDHDGGEALLLEFLQPHPSEAPSAAQLMRLLPALHAVSPPAPELMWAVPDLFESQFSKHEARQPANRDVVELGRRLLDSVSDAAAPPTLLHGDLSPHNAILTESGDLRVIDPAALYGDPAFDAAKLLWDSPERDRLSTLAVSLGFKAETLDLYAALIATEKALSWLHHLRLSPSEASTMVEAHTGHRLELSATADPAPAA